MKFEFKDLFSGHAAEYAKFRPQYPKPLFEFLAGKCAVRETAWDCATGNGQCAIPLAEFFDEVIATDASEKQLKNALPNPRVNYRMAAAEESGLASQSVDLITVAQALHWFRIDEFLSEAGRVLKPTGILAVWCYGFVEITPEIDAVMNHFYHDLVGPYWPPERKMVESGYQSISFPFAEIETPMFFMEATWSMSALAGYVRTWSATQKYMAANATDPVDSILPALTKAWGDPGQPRDVRWPLSIRVGRNMPRNS